MMGGRGQRMGGVDKSTLNINGRSFYDIAISRLNHAFQSVAVSTGAHPNANVHLPQFTDIDVHGEAIGPSGGLLAALNWADSLGLEAVITLPVDTPILPDNICERLRASGQACYAQYGDQAHWLHASWPISERSALRHYIIDKQIYSLQELHRAIGSRPVMFESPKEADVKRVQYFKNINTPQDLKSLREI